MDLSLVHHKQCCAVQLREAAAAAMARHKGEAPPQAVERAIDIPGDPPGRLPQHAKRAQRQYRQRGGEEEADAGAAPARLPNQDAGVAAATRMQEQEYEARARAKRGRGGRMLSFLYHVVACSTVSAGAGPRLCFAHLVVPLTVTGPVPPMVQ